MPLSIFRKGGSRFVGEVVYGHPASGKRYIGDLRFYQGRGYDLTGWVLAGTVPTVDVNGDIDFYATGGNFSRGSYLIPNTMGKFDFILGCRFTRQSDDILTSWSPIISWNSGGADSGIGSRFAAVQVSGRWFNTGAVGTETFVAFTQQIGVENTLVIIKTQNDLLYFVNDTLMLSIPVSVRGNAPLSLHPQQAWHSVNKSIFFDTESAGPGQPTHKKMREFYVAQLIGQGAI